MVKTDSVKLVRETFESPFDRARFIKFVWNLLNEPESAEFIRKGNLIPDAYQDFISKYERIGKYTDSEKHRIDILIVTLKKETSIERARSIQRNFIARYLQGHYGTDTEKDAALVAFVSPDGEDWRFSLVKLDVRLEKTPKGRLKAVDEFTPARRWSFLVGVHEKSHTAQSRLVPIISDDEHNPTLEKLEEAFNVEKVTKEFFVKYRDLFIRTKGELDKAIATSPKTKADFENKGVDTINLAKKLLGQIIFLYFLQKKGWFGVPRDGEWGEGAKNFLRDLFEKKHCDYKNFFKDILEPLFYEALRNDRSYDDHYYSRFDCKIPFLNGGLFDPMNNYDWVKTDLLLPNELFHNEKKTKEGDTGDGILDVFDRYNFTVKEDEPFEKEVAIDPELLGKAYEKFNAIRPDNFSEYLKALKSSKKGEETKFNKQYGVYPTPREIVHYMCQQSLINYLASELDGKATKEDITILVQTGENLREHEAQAAIKQTKTYSPKLPDSIRQNAQLIDEKLARIKVCDPAVGSGAFPVGMMGEIVKARQALAIYQQTSEFLKYSEVLSAYHFKRECIENSLYGVDIDAGAVEIAKLRLWLSLIVDEDDPKNIKPLPNLDYKIIRGNSLVEILTPGWLVGTSDPERIGIINRLNKAKDELFNLSVPNQKEQKRSEIEALIQELFDNYRNMQKKKLQEKLIGINASKRLIVFEDMKLQKEDQKKAREIEIQIEEIKNLQLPTPSGHFEWHIVFSEVFHDKGGFDIVMANPPYVKERDSKATFEDVRKSSLGKTYNQSKMDYWYYFLHRAIELCRKDFGFVSFITSRYWLQSSGAKKLIKHIRNSTTLFHIVDIGDLTVFEDVVGYHMVHFYRTRVENQDCIIKKLENNLDDIGMWTETNNLSIYSVEKEKLFTPDEKVNISKDIIDFLTFDILDTYFEVSQGVVQNPDKVSSKMAKLYGLNQGDGVFVLKQTEINQLRFAPKEKAFLKPFYDEEAIEKFYLRSNNPQQLLYMTRNNCKSLSDYPNIKQHLAHFKKIMDARRETKNGTNKWFHLHWPRDERYFKSEKIAIPSMFIEPKAVYLSSSAYFGLGTNLIISKSKKFSLKALAGILNSRFAYYWFVTFGKHRGAGVDIGVEKLRYFPLPNYSKEEELNKLTDFVDRIMGMKRANPQADTCALEKEIDQLVYQLYGLTEEEIRVVEEI